MTVKELMAGVQELMGDDYIVNEQNVVKNNGVKLNGLSIGKKESRVAATIYIKEGMTPEEIVELYNNNAETTDKVISAVNQDIISKDFILDNVYPMLVNRERNAEILKKAVHEPYADLEIVFRVNIGEGSFIVNKDILDGIGVSSEQLSERAKDNINGKCTVEDIIDLLAGFGVPDISNGGGGFMKVISTEGRVNGSGAILDRELVKQLHEQLGDKFVVIPSSIHELIVVPHGDTDIMSIAEIIKEVNATQLDPKDFLSDNAYIFTDKMEVA